MCFCVSVRVCVCREGEEAAFLILLPVYIKITCKRSENGYEVEILKSFTIQCTQKLANKSFAYFLGSLPMKFTVEGFIQRV